MRPASRPRYLHATQTDTLDNDKATDEKLSSSLQAADPLSAMQAMTADLSVPEPTLEPPECGGRDPGVTGHFKMHHLWSLQSAPPRMGVF